MTRVSAGTCSFERNDRCCVPRYVCEGTQRRVQFIFHVQFKLQVNQSKRALGRRSWEGLPLPLRIVVVQLLEGAKDSEHVVKCGYLHKYRPFSGGLFSPSWALRFFRSATAHRHLLAKARACARVTNKYTVQNSAGGCNHRQRLACKHKMDQHLAWLADHQHPIRHTWPAPGCDPPPRAFTRFSIYLPSFR